MAICSSKAKWYCKLSIIVIIYLFFRYIMILIIASYIAINSSWQSV